MHAYLYYYPLSWSLSRHRVSDVSWRLTADHCRRCGCCFFWRRRLDWVDSRTSLTSTAGTGDVPVYVADCRQWAPLSGDVDNGCCQSLDTCDWRHVGIETRSRSRAQSWRRSSMLPARPPPFYSRTITTTSKPLIIIIINNNNNNNDRRLRSAHRSV